MSPPAATNSAGAPSGSAATRRCRWDDCTLPVYPGSLSSHPLGAAARRSAGVLLYDLRAGHCAVTEAAAADWVAPSGRDSRLRRPLIAAIAELVAAKPDNQYKIREIDGGEQD